MDDVLGKLSEITEISTKRRTAVNSEGDLLAIEDSSDAAGDAPASAPVEDKKGSKRA